MRKQWKYCYSSYNVISICIACGIPKPKYLKVFGGCKPEQGHRVNKESERSYRQGNEGDFKEDVDIHIRNSNYTRCSPHETKGRGDIVV